MSRFPVEHNPSQPVTMYARNLTDGQESSQL